MHGHRSNNGTLGYGAKMPTVTPYVGIIASQVDGLIAHRANALDYDGLLQRLARDHNTIDRNGICCTRVDDDIVTRR